jgi:hypothetical protein
MEMLSDHWPAFAYFVKAEVDAGGPDCQLHLLLECAPHVSTMEKVWLAGCYGAHHCVPSAYAVWLKYRPDELLESYANGRLQQWLESHWSALPVRPEMRSHRMVEKRAQCLHDFALYTIQEAWADPRQTYDTLWDDSQARIKYYGRYMAIKYLELIRRVARPDIQVSDIRSRAAWSPRITLGMLFPNHFLQLSNREDNSEDTLQVAEDFATITLERLNDRGVSISYFQLQVLLCNYREALNGGTAGFYPGAGHDEEMDYIDVAMPHFGDQVTYLYDVRKRAFKPEYLGELNGWHGLRPEKFQEWADLLLNFKE